ncbi:MAG: TonB-dependent receptor domain-containing protein, partial [Bryobacteraceae bacterium]
QHPFLYNPKLNYSFIRGRHSMKTGYEFQRVHTEIQDVNPLYGNDIYNGQFSRVAGSPNPSSFDANSYTLADFMFGARSEYQLVNFYIAQYRQVMHFAYFQDDWKVTPKLTLNLGARYEFATPQWESGNRLSNFDPVSNRLIPAKDGSISDRAQVNPDRNNWAPRVGLAYSFNPRTVLRAGYGISYVHFNRVGGGNILGINGPQVVIAVIAQNPTQPGFRPTQDGYPAGLTDPDKFNPITANISYMPRETPSGYSQNWAFSVQREVVRNLLVDLGYVGSRSNHLVLFADFNQARPNRSGENLPIQARRPNQSFGAITVTFPAGWSNYHALQARVEKRLSGGLYLLNSFVYSKAMDNVGQALEAQGSGGRSSPQTFFNLRAEKAVADFDQTINNTTSVVYELPFGRGRKHLASLPRAADYAIGGWQLTAINNMWSGPPLNLSYDAPAAFQVSQTLPDWRGGISYRPNLIGPLMLPKDQRTIDNYFERNNVVIPADPSQVFGNAGRNVGRGYPLYQLDFGLTKIFAVRETARVEFRTEAFNVFNKTNFRFNTANAMNRSNAAFGTVRSTFPARQIQFALRLVF